jgi:serine/threonine protein kinase/tetratricopeptide (TPR) repeat protein
VGQVFGDRYHIIRMLGMGGMGAVYQAWDSELEVALALKVIRPDATQDAATAAEIERRFKRELLLARQVTHPNVVRIHDLGEIDGIKYITMPYVQGTDLAHVLSERKTLPVPQALHIARQIAAGLQAAHSAGVVHRDLKPANIMIDADDRALIMDFGIARGSTAAPGTGLGPSGMAPSHAAVTHFGAVIGTIDYMAPEQARGEPVDHRADIYAFGLILYRMLVGKRLAPGAADALSDLTARMSHAPTSLRKIDASIPEDVERIASRCLEPDPAARYQTTSQLVDALAGLDDQGVRLTPPPHFLKSWRFWTAAALVLAASVTATWLLGRFSRPPSPVQRDPIGVLVADASNRTGEAVFDGLLEQALTVGIEGAPFISAYQRPAALRVARLLKAGDQLDESAARLVALREGIKIVLLPAIEKRGSSYALSVRGIDPTTPQRVLASSESDATTRDDVLRAGGMLATRLRSALGDTRAADPKETLSSSSLEAVSAYIRAQELSSAGKDQEALAYFREATTRDEKFGRAFGGWAMSATRLGRRADAEPLWQKALSLLNNMTNRERYRLEGAYFTLYARNYDKAIDTYSTLVKEYPADGAGHNNLAVAYFRRLEFSNALEEGRKVLQTYPNSPLYRTNLALYGMYAGDFSSAATDARKLVDEGVANFDAFLPIAVSGVAAGRPDEARAAYERMRQVDSGGASLASIGVADLLLYEGRAAEAAAALRAGIDEDVKLENPAGVAAKQVALADALGTVGNTKGAVAAARAALAIDQTEAQIVPAVQWLVAAGNIEEATQLKGELDRRLETQPRAYARVVAGQMALAKGQRVEAVDALREAIKLADLWLARFFLGRAYLNAGYYAEALSEFETCFKRRGEGYAVFLDDVPTTRYVAPVRYWIGRAHEGLGLVDQAKADYKTFVDSQSKESVDPLFKDARARLAKWGLAP